MTDAEMGEAVRYLGVLHAQSMLRQVVKRHVRFSTISVKIEVTLPEGGDSAILTLSRSGGARKFWVQGHGDGKAVAAIRRWVNYGQVPIGEILVEVTTLSNGQGSYLRFSKPLKGKISLNCDGDPDGVAAIRRWLGI